MWLIFDTKFRLLWGFFCAFLRSEFASLREGDHSEWYMMVIGMEQAVSLSSPLHSNTGSCIWSLLITIIKSTLSFPSSGFLVVIGVGAESQYCHWNRIIKPNCPFIQYHLNSTTPSTNDPYRITLTSHRCCVSRKRTDIIRVIKYDHQCPEPLATWCHPCYFLLPCS